MKIWVASATDGSPIIVFDSRAGMLAWLDREGYEKPGPEEQPLWYCREDVMDGGGPAPLLLTEHPVMSGRVRRAMR